MNPKPSGRSCTLALALCLAQMGLLPGPTLGAENQPAPKPAATKAVTIAPRNQVTRLKLLPPGPDNPRNSEVAFLRLKDGRIFMVYSHFSGKQGADESPCFLAGRYSSDGGKTWTNSSLKKCLAD